MHYRQCGPFLSQRFGGGVLLCIIGLVIIIALIWYFTRQRQAKPKVENTALRILEERYARGEIDEVEFVSKKKILEDSQE